MGHITGYFDDSGSHPASPILTVAGVIGPAGSWREFENAWEGSLPRDVSEFKAADLEYNGRTTRPLSNLSRADKAELKRNLIDVVAQHGLYGASVSLDLPSFWMANAHLRKHSTFPYFLCALGCFWVMHRIVEGNAGSSLQVTFDEHAKVRGQMEALFEGMQSLEAFARFYRLYPPKFESSSMCVPLQAADLLAHSSNKHFKSLTKHPDALARLGDDMKAEHRTLSESARPSMKRLHGRMYNLDFATGWGIAQLIERVEPYLRPVFPELYP
ncbi:MAG TPA: DUF3800 domain-containing protein [Bryobacteraceae bacterium]|jgi:hypothetical protein